MEIARQAPAAKEKKSPPVEKPPLDEIEQMIAETVQAVTTTGNEHEPKI